MVNNRRQPAAGSGAAFVLLLQSCPLPKRPGHESAWPPYSPVRSDSAVEWSSTAATASQIRPAAWSNSVSGASQDAGYAPDAPPHVKYLTSTASKRAAVTGKSAQWVISRVTV